MTLSEQLAAFAVDLTPDDIPDDAGQHVRLHVLDILGVCLLASRQTFADTIFAVARAMGGSDDHASVVGRPEQLGAPHAAFVNAAFAHGVEFDDTYAPGRWHGSAPVVPGALAVGEDRHVSGSELATAITVGLEVGCRLTAAAPTLLYRGFHSTATVGTLAVAVAASRLMGLDAERTSHAIGIAGGFAGGSAEFLADHDPWIKRLQVGYGVHGGIVAALAAAEGCPGPATILDGDYGYFEAHAGPGNYDLDVVTDGLGDRWELRHLYPKRYPCDHLAQGYIDAVASLVADGSVRADEVERVECVVHPLVVPVMFEPHALRYRPPNGWSARWSMPFNVAVALIDGTIDVDSYDDARVDAPDVQALMDRVEHVADPTLAFPEDYPAVVRVHTTDGQVHLVERLKVAGSPENPLSALDYEAKFRRNADGVLTADEQDTCIGLIDTMTTLDDSAELARAFRRSG